VARPALWVGGRIGIEWKSVFLGSIVREVTKTKAGGRRGKVFSIRPEGRRRGKDIKIWGGEGAGERKRKRHETEGRNFQVKKKPPVWGQEEHSGRRHEVFGKN